jgi:hypothetical protein
MKKYILSITILAALLACNETTTIQVSPPDPATDSALQKGDTTKIVKPVKNIGFGLTQEEMADDTLFIDGSRPTSWELAGIKDVKGFKLFIKQLQLLVLNNDKTELAKHIRYPLGKSIKTEADFIKNYDNIFTKDAKLSIAKINFSQIFRNAKGAMSEGGYVWFSQEGDGFKIIAVNK